MKWALSRKNLWNKVPGPAKAALARVLGTVPPQVLLGKRFRQTLRFVRRAQWWPVRRAEEYQLERIRSICALAYRKSPYYRRAFRDAGFEPGDLKSVQDLDALPTINKNTVHDHLDEMCCRSPNSLGVDYVTTGGTSGTPLRFYIGADRSAVESAYLFACWERVGYRPDVPMAVFRGRVVLPDRRDLRHEYDPILRHHYYSNFHMTDENVGRYMEHVRGIGDCFLHVYPSSAAALARFLRRTGMSPPHNIRGIIAESEIMYPDQRKRIEEVFGCRCFSCYGHTEKLVLAAECEHSTAYHVWPTYGYFELLDEQGQAVTEPGRRGEIVGTGFINTVTPFIRYRTGDYATYVADRCEACGRKHPLIEDIRGHRTQEMLVAADGSHISWTALNMHDDTFDNVMQFRFRQDTPGRATLMIVPAPGMSRRDEQRIRRNLSQKLDGRVTINLELCDRIPASPRGKAVYVEQRIPREQMVDA